MADTCAPIKLVVKRRVDWRKHKANQWELSVWLPGGKELTTRCSRTLKNAREEAQLLLDGVTIGKKRLRLNAALWVL